MYANAQADPRKPIAGFVQYPREYCANIVQNIDNKVLIGRKDMRHTRLCLFSTNQITLNLPLAICIAPVRLMAYR